MHDFGKANDSDLMDKINATGDFGDEIAAGLKAVCEGFAEKGAF